MARLNGGSGGGGGGNISGTGADTQVARFDGAQTIFGDANLIYDPNSYTLQLFSPLEVNEPFLSFRHDSDNGNLFLGDNAGQMQFWSKGDDAAFHLVTSIFTRVANDNGKFGQVVIAVDPNATDSPIDQLVFSPSNNIELGDDVVFELDRAAYPNGGQPQPADTSQGWDVVLTATETFTRGQVGYIDSDGNASLANATDNTKNPVTFIARQDVTAGDKGRFLLYGIIDLTTMAPGWTIGATIYLDTTNGGMTMTAPSSTGNMVQVLGIAYPPAIAGTPNTANKLLFNPQLVMVEHA